MTRGVVNLEEVVVPFYNRVMQLCTVSLAATLGTPSCLHVFLSMFVCQDTGRDREKENMHSVFLFVLNNLSFTLLYYLKVSLNSR